MRKFKTSFKSDAEVIDDEMEQKDSYRLKQRKEEAKQLSKAIGFFNKYTTSIEILRNG